MAINRRKKFETKDNFLSVLTEKGPRLSYCNIMNTRLSYDVGQIPFLGNKTLLSPMSTCLFTLLKISKLSPAIDILILDPNPKAGLIYLR